jgi:hypothetical protein
MAARDDGMDSFVRASERGLLRLMMRLPAVRGQLQILAKTSRSLVDLLEAYEAAASTLERLSKQPSRETVRLRAEYETICQELETEVTGHCLRLSQSDTQKK